tara:strand:+ start:48 stop:449 length:402 start_codon:yes stop_codon:yes gene_type:complete
MKHFNKKKISKATSYRMSRIAGKDTNPERYVRSILHKNGFRFSLHKKDLPGKPDIVLTKYKSIINVNGCFWHHHNCGRYKIPKNNRKFWLNKFKDNKKRDINNTLKLKKLGWKVYKVWECSLKKNINLIINKL